MEDSDTIPKPSTALKVMAEEHLFLNEFLEMVQRRHADSFPMYAHLMVASD
jgi:hypothetical protein